MTASLHILGIRHHGPGSARAMLQVLESIRPDCLLIEGPADAEGVLQWVAHQEMEPPVALLIYAADDPKQAVFAPFAEYSPEWCALRWSIDRGTPVRFMDLPQAHRIAITHEHNKEAKETSDADREAKESDSLPAESTARLRHDPLDALARGAGFDDGERWWEHMIEHRRHEGGAVFDVIRDAMLALRQEMPMPEGHDAQVEALREAWMRRTIREARKEFGSVVVICGAWHSAVLDDESLSARRKEDDALLKGLPKIKTVTTWVPWTYEHLAAASGYGAGVRSPGWYEHLWRTDDAVIERWMTRVARLLRAEGHDCSTAHAIEASRLAGSLATLRDRPLADLSDIADACRSVFCFDSDLGMKLIGRKLLLGERLGTVPSDAPLAPLQRDLRAEQRRLRLKPEASEKALKLDLRNETDLARSHLLHRLRLLGVEWGLPEHTYGDKGTFHEEWRLRWDPVYLVRLIEYGRFGSTVRGAASTFVERQALESKDLPSLTRLLDDVLLADLPAAVETLMDRILAIAAVGADVSVLMATFPPLARVVRYGNVRKTDTDMVWRAIRGVLPRICVGFPSAATALNDEASRGLEAQVNHVHEGVTLLGSQEYTDLWLDSLRRAADSDSVHGLLRGRCARLLFDSAASVDDAARRLGLALSRGNDAAAGAAWIEGFFKGSGLLLVHHSELLQILDEWLCSIPAEAFLEQVPLLRRTFSTFEVAERRQLSERLRQATPARSSNTAVDFGIDRERAARVLPILRALLGGPPTPGEST